jgi:transketolase
LWTAAKAIDTNELLTYRKFGSDLEGHPTANFRYGSIATGSLGQGLSAGLGYALNAKYLDNLDYKTYVLLGDGELSEGSIWEAANLASHYKLDNLVAILDCNKFEQASETILKWDLETYKKRFESFGWYTIVIEDGHDIQQVITAFEQIKNSNNMPVCIIAKTVKGKGIKMLEDRLEWHGKALKREELETAMHDLGRIDFNVDGNLVKPNSMQVKKTSEDNFNWSDFKAGEFISTRKAYGDALVQLANKYPSIVALDGGTQNSTFSQTFQKQFPKRFFDMYIAEQNMVSAAVALSKSNKIPFVSTFAAFFSRAFDQIRMSQYSNSNVKFVGSHAGISIGEDGPSQMGLEDIALFRSIQNCVVLYPSDAVSMERAVYLAAEHEGNVYIRSTRMDTPVIYSQDTSFKIGGSKILKESVYDSITVVGAGITLHEAIKAYEKLKEQNIFIRVVDLYSIKPIDYQTLNKCIRETKAVLVVEDHYSQGGIAEAIKSELTNIKTKVFSLSVNKIPRSGKPFELLDYAEISAKSITEKVKEIINSF